MSANKPNSEVHKWPNIGRRWTWRRTIWLASFLGIAVPFAYFWSMLSAPYPAIEISKETTWLTSPVDADGYVNYPAALRELTAPDQKDWKRDLIRGVIYRDAVPSSRQHYPDRPFFEFPPDWNDVAETDAVMPSPRNYRAPNFWADHTPLPFSSLQRPIMANLVAENEEWFDELTRAANEPWSVPDGRVPGDLPLSPLCARLAIRIQLRVGEGSYEEAFADIDTLRAFAARQPQYPEPMMGQTAMQVETMACVQASLAILHSDTITDDMENWVNVLPQQASLRKAQAHHGTMVRVDDLENLKRMHQLGPPKNRVNDLPTFVDTAHKRLSHDGLNWNRLLRLRNQLFDTLSKEMFRPTGWPRQKAAIDDFNKTIPDINGPNTRSGDWLRHGFDNETDFWHARHVRFRLYGARDLVIANHRLTAAYRMVRVALAMKRWQIQHSSFPETLQQLVDANLTTTERITDPFSEQPFVYQQSPLKYRVYSTGPNMLDDFGVPQYFDIPDEHRDTNNRDKRTGRYPDDTPSILWKR